MVCSNCGAKMEQSNGEEVVCPYCGCKEMIEESDAVKIQKIKSNTYKEVELAKIDSEKSKNERESEDNERDKYKKSKLCKVTVAFFFICLFALVVAFSQKHFLAGFIALLQVAAFAISWLWGMQILKEKKRFLHVALAIVGLAFVILFIRCNVADGDRIARKEKAAVTFSWPSTTVSSLIPKPDTDNGKISHSSDDWLAVDVYNISAKEFTEYVNKCKDCGFTKDSSESSTYYYADDANKNDLTLHYYEDSKEMHISISKYTEPVQETVKTEIEKETPEEEPEEIEVDAEENELTEEDEKTESEDVEEEKEEDESVLSGVVDPDLKAFLDSYEKFIDEYIEFMDKYSKSEDTISMLADYTKMVQQLADYEDKPSKYDTKTMSPADEAYYLEVTMRIEKKLLKAAY